MLVVVSCLSRYLDYWFDHDIIYPTEWVIGRPHLKHQLAPTQSFPDREPCSQTCCWHLHLKQTNPVCIGSQQNHFNEKVKKDPRTQQEAAQHALSVLSVLPVWFTYMYILSCSVLLFFLFMHICFYCRFVRTLIYAWHMLRPVMVALDVLSYTFLSFAE